MTARVYTSILTAVLALAVAVPASAQISVPLWRPTLLDHTGVITAWGTVPPRIPTTWIAPSYVLHYNVPQPIFVPIPEARRAVEPVAMEPVAVAVVTLRSGVMPEGLSVRGGTVVTWENGGNRARTLIIAPAGSAGTSGSVSTHGWQLLPNGRFSMALHQRGSYEYYLLEEPARRGQIVVQ